MTDQERARHYRDHGYTEADIAVVLGCSQKWVHALLNDAYRKRHYQRSRAYQDSGVCPKCGGRMTNPKHGIYVRGQAHERCAKCYHDEQAAASFARRVVGDTLLCRVCHTYKPFSAYPQRSLAKFLERRRGRSPQCTACNTVARTAYRQRHRVPCIECGQPRTGDGKRRNERGIDTGLCRDCYQGRTEAA